MTQTGKNTNKPSNINRIRRRVKKSLDKYAEKVLFPAKLEQANKLIKGVKIP